MVNPDVGGKKRYSASYVQKLREEAMRYRLGKIEAERERDKYKAEVEAATERADRAERQLALT